MKSRNLKVIFASVLTVALLATAVTGFAAQDATVATTTTYNTVDGKVDVKTEVTGATANSEVTYLVKSGETIVYIDQDTVEDDGTVGFEYKIAQDKIAADFQTQVKFGTNVADTFTGEGAKDLGIKVLNDVEKDTYTITYVEDAAGNGDTVTANIVPAADYEIVEIKVGDIIYPGVTTFVKVGKDDVITVETRKKIVTPAIQYAKEIDGKDGGYVTIIKVVGSPYEVGVVYNGNRYPAKMTNMTEKDKMVAVKLILPKDENPDLSAFEAYFMETEESKELNYNATEIN